MSELNQLPYHIALSLIPGIGCINAKKLIAYMGSVQAIFEASERMLLKVPGIGAVLARNIVEHRDLERGRKELEFLNKYKIKTTCYWDSDYPGRLKRCVDAPLVLFSKGNIAWNSEKIVAIVGTRNATDYGKKVCDELVAAMAERGGYTVVSGLAYGIDSAGHKACLQHGVPTWGVLAHGLDTIYPALHRSLAERMLVQGGVITDFLSQTKLDRNNFLRRNRIVAGLADATIVVESAAKGGALVTADIAGSYNRDVFAVPGRIADPFSQGCNELIQQNKACLIQSLSDLEYFMGWEKSKAKSSHIQKQLFVELTTDEQQLLNSLTNEPVYIDQLCQKVNMPMGKVSSLLLNLEFNGLVLSLPGKMYRLN
ncbi:DNA-processing protein DprA [Mangrovibacterium marinum]|uniref:DNA processing protein n=1 Tax=Mangrovibacterium marinum TaxID=1639118 RepID=A0A2T5C048_9BACT|nr:DNA-processing protein DprA [Mangrovibacterium marinum]PTN07939.1 DNA processing protein [Mangrovibacterium marinum]